jgi:hypothetical protein
MQYSSEYLQLLNESALRTLCEAISKSDIIDTYILMSMPDIEDDAAQFVKKEIMDAAKTNIIEELTRILEKEVSHMRGESDTHEYGLAAIKYMGVPGEKIESIDRQYLKPITKTFNLPAIKNPETEKEIVKLYKDVAKKLEAGGSGRADTLTLAEIHGIFENFSWYSGYGGKNWARITAHVQKIAGAANQTEFFKALDRLVDFVHNTGSILTKFQGYAEGWIQFILDLKEKATNIRELIPYASPEVKKMFGSQEWRQLMTRIPGEGAERSIESYKQMLPKYVQSLYDLERKNRRSTNINWWEVKQEAGRWIGAIGSVVQSIGAKRAHEILAASGVTDDQTFLAADVVFNNAVRKNEIHRIAMKFMKPYLDREED